VLGDEPFDALRAAAMELPDEINRWRRGNDCWASSCWLTRCLSTFRSIWYFAKCLLTVQITEPRIDTDETRISWVMGRAICVYP
jgi:hypothetical protein